MSQASTSAHVEDGSGTFILPAHSPYERQMVREHVQMRARRVAMLTLGLDGTQWTVTRQPLAGSQCATCTQGLGLLSCRRDDGAAPSCLDCAMQFDKKM